MNGPIGAAEIAVAAGLEKSGADVERIGPAEWRLALSNGRRIDVAATVDTNREWLFLDADAGTPTAGYWPTLALNATLAGNAKVVLHSSRLRLKAEVPVARHDVLAARIVATCSGFKAALAALEAGTHAIALESGKTRSDELDPTVDLRARCRESGWNVTERSNGCFTADLGCTRRFYQAFVAPVVTGGVLISADLMKPSVLSPSSKHALAAFLLSTTAVLRFARAAAVEEGERALVRLEVPVDTAPDVTDLDHAFCALSAGCNLAGDEARALQDEMVALRYLAVRTASKDAHRGSHRRSRSSRDPVENCLSQESCQ